MKINENLKSIGLTDSEIKVYLALLELGLSSKGKILEKTKTAPSKIYHVLNKLMEKGLVSMIIKNNVKNYASAPIQRIKDFIQNKKKELEQEEKLVDKMIPTLELLQKTAKEKPTAEIFFGWKGLETAYSTAINLLNKGENIWILGASRGEEVNKTKRFFLKYSLKAKLKGLNVRVIFNENARNYVKDIETQAKITFNKKFLFKNTPVEIAIAKDLTAIVMLKTEPIVILIKDKQTADSFITYFKELWNIAKP